MRTDDTSALRSVVENPLAACGLANTIPSLMTIVRLKAVTFGYSATPVVRGVSLVALPSQLVTLLGPSGCGKTTLLKLIGGYLTPTTGRIELCDRDVTELPPEKRNAGMVFQNYALFPHLTARENVAFGLEARGIARAERERRVGAMLDCVGLSAAELDRKPAALSGGQQQRVALARTRDRTGRTATRRAARQSRPAPS